MPSTISKAFFLLLILSILSCGHGFEYATSGTNAAPAEIPQENKDKIVESFSDDLKIARRGKNKIQIDVVEGSGVDLANRPNNVAIIRFYSITSSGDWGLKQTLEIETHALMGADPKIEDFNNDGFKDITFVSNTAARAANEVRTLLIYDKAGDRLIHIRNSERYPNLAYNRKLNCIDSWMFHGATTTMFLRLDGDILKEFAAVNTGSELIVDLIDENEGRKEIYRKRMSLDDVYTRFETFDPPRAYSENDPASSFPRRF